MVKLGSTAVAALRVADDLCSRVASLPSPGSLVVALFHAIHRDAAQLGSGVLAPNQDITVDDLRRFLDAALSAGYTLVSAADLDSGRLHGTRNMLLSFDDGYFNNTWALPVLEEFRVPGLFFITTSHVQERKAFWWDAASRALSQYGLSDVETSRALEQLKHRHPTRIERELKACHGTRALDPVGDLDRPFSPDELRDFARHRWVTLGNHTHDHVILPRCTPAEMQEQIWMCQRELESMANVTAKAFAYPNGDYSADAISAARGAGLKLGFTVRPRRAYLPFSDGSDAMAIGRHLVWGGRSFSSQCRQMGARFVPGNFLRAVRNAVRSS